MVDIFDNTILCKKCNRPMEQGLFSRNGFKMRAVFCEKCNLKINHPTDEEEYKRFVNLKNKDFRVKMRIVGNSYTVSIPKEIVSFIHEQERLIDDMVRLCFESSGKISLNFDKLLEDKDEQEK